MQKLISERLRRVAGSPRSIIGVMADEVEEGEQRYLRAIDAIERVLAGHIDKRELHIILRAQAEAI